MLILVEAYLVNGDDVGMLQAGRRRGLGAKSLHQFRAGERAEEQHLHGDDTVQAALSRLVNDAHAAAGNFLQQFVIAKRTGRLVLELGRGGLLSGDEVLVVRRTARLRRLWSKSQTGYAFGAKTFERFTEQVGAAFQAFP